MGWFQDIQVGGGQTIKNFIPADNPPPQDCTAVFDVAVEDEGWTGVERLEVAEKDLTEEAILAAAAELAKGARVRAEAQAEIDAEAEAAEEAAMEAEISRQERLYAAVQNAVGKAVDEAGKVVVGVVEEVTP
jgi:hypothetical protein